MLAPTITNSTKKQREEYIYDRYACKSDCDSCGMCKVLKGKTPEIVFEDYIEGNKELSDICLW